MQLKSISGVMYRAKDLKVTAEFYEKLGFRMGKQEGNKLTVYVNWFWIEFQSTEDSEHVDNKNSGAFLYISVDDVDEFYQGVLAQGIKPISEPTDSDMSRRELAIVDPDGYKLVFFRKK